MNPMAEMESDTLAHIRLARQDDRVAVEGVVYAAYGRYGSHSYRPAETQAAF
jgi:hypothetical protein